MEHLSYECDVSGKRTKGYATDDDDLPLPVGWAQVVISVRVPNTAYADAVATRAAMVEEAKASGATDVQIDALIPDVDEPRTVVEERIAHVSPEHVGKLAALLNLDVTT